MLIDTNENPTTINFAPSLSEEIMQNVRTILKTVKYSVPLGREFGISWDAIDMPIALARAKIINEIINAIKRYEPRVEVTNIDFTSENTDNTDNTTDALTGVLRPKVTLRVKNDGF